MFENRNLKQDIFAIALLAAIAFLLVSLVSYSPADPIEAPVAPFNLVYTPDHLVFPQHEEITNRCGYGGAVVADILLNSLGLGAYFLVGSLLWVDIVLLRRRTLESPWLRSIGWTITLIGFTSLSTLLVPTITLGPIVGPGGYLGALSAGLLESQFATLGAVILSISVFVSGLLLYTDYAIVRTAKWAVLHLFLGMSVVGNQLPVKGLVRTGKIKPLALGGEEEVELEEGEEEEQEESEPAIRIAGRKVGEVVAEEEPEEEEVEEDEEVEEEEGEEEEAEEAVDEAEEEDEGDIPVKVPAKKEETARAVHQPPHFKVKKPEKTERETVMTALNQASHTELSGDYQLPEIEMLKESEEFCFEEQEVEVRKKARILEKTFNEFGFKVKVVEIETGPVIAQYEIQLEAGLRLSKITGLADDLAIALRVPSVRIVAPIPGKNTVGIEVPNETRQVVRLREVIETSTAQTKKMKIPLFLGKDVSGNPLVADLAALPHLLIAGRTGTGKSVCLNAIISSILMTRRPDEVRMLMIDPKMVELSGYGRLPHLMHPVVTDMKKAEAILAWAVDKMEERYSLLAQAGVRHITTYNQLGEAELMRRLAPDTDEERNAIPLHLPFIVIVADEMADLMMTAGKEVEQHIIRLAQKSRAVGIHLILATQKPTVDVITGLIKSNLPARIAFQVASRTDSRVVLDEMGADKLLGNGDMLFLGPGTSTLLRGQGTYLSDEEIDSVTNEVSTGEQHFVNELVNLKVEATEGAEDRMAELKKRDELYESAIDIVVREGRGSVSLLQRALGIGYGRAARLVDFMAEDNIVGPYAGSQAREVLVSMDEWQAMQGLSESSAKSAPARSNRIVPEPEPEVEEDPLDDDAHSIEEHDGDYGIEAEDEYEEEESQDDEYEEELEDDDEVELSDEEENEDEVDEEEDLDDVVGEVDDDEDFEDEDTEEDDVDEPSHRRTQVKDHRIRPSGALRGRARSRGNRSDSNRLGRGSGQAGKRAPFGRAALSKDSELGSDEQHDETESGSGLPAPKGRSARRPRNTKLMASKSVWNNRQTSEWDAELDAEADLVAEDDVSMQATTDTESKPARSRRSRKPTSNRIRLHSESSSAEAEDLDDLEGPPIVRSGKHVSSGKWSLAQPDEMLEDEELEDDELDSDSELESNEDLYDDDAALEDESDDELEEEYLEDEEEEVEDDESEFEEDEDESDEDDLDEEDLDEDEDGEYEEDDEEEPEDEGELEEEYEESEELWEDEDEEEWDETESEDEELEDEDDFEDEESER